MKIFIVEDQKIILQGIRKMFTHFSDDEIHLFSDPAAALAQAAQLQPDAVFTDIVMEGMDGLALIRSISELLPRCRFVIISGFADFEYARQAISLKVDAYLLKPIDRTALEDAWRKLRADSAPVPDAAPEKPRLRISDQAMSYICANSVQALSISSVAAHIHISPNYLSNVFRKETGTSVNEAIRREQMKAAARLLRTTDMYLYEIAEQLGYKDVKYFSLLFKAYYQITPKGYRQQCLKEVHQDEADQPE